MDATVALGTGNPINDGVRRCLCFFGTRLNFEALGLVGTIIIDEQVDSKVPQFL